MSLQVERGEVFGFLGPNGASKTTTIRTMLDLLRPTEGRAALLGLDSRRDALEIHRRVGYLPGDFNAYRRMTGRGYLEFFAALRASAPPPSRVSPNDSGATSSLDRLPLARERPEARTDPGPDASA